MPSNLHILQYFDQGILFKVVRKPKSEYNPKTKYNINKTLNSQIGDTE